MVDNRQYRLMKLGTPGPYTFILDATEEVPRRVSHPSRKTIGLRVPDRKGTAAAAGVAGSTSAGHHLDSRPTRPSP